MRRRGQAGNPFAQGGAAGGDGLGLERAVGALPQVRLKLKLPHKVELTVGIGLKQKVDVVAVHGFSPFRPP